MNKVELAEIAARNFRDSNCPDNELDRHAAAECMETVIKQAKLGNVDALLCIDRAFDFRYKQMVGRGTRVQG